MPRRILASLNNLPLKASLTLTYGFLIILLITLLTFFLGQAARNLLKQEQSDAMESLAYQIADKLDRSLYERFRDLATAASISTPQGPLLSNPHLARIWLNELKDKYPLYAWIGFADAQGQVLVSSGAMLEGSNVSARPWFIKGREKPFFGDVHKAKLLENLLPQREEPWRFIDIAVPITLDDGGLEGVLGAHLSWEWAEDLTANVLLSSGADTDLDVLIIDREGDLVLGPESLRGISMQDYLPPKRAVARVYSYEGGWPDGDAFLNAVIATDGFEQLNTFDWDIVIRRSADQAFASVDVLRAQTLGYGLGAAAVFLLIVWYTAYRITRPLAQLSVLATKVSSDQTVVFWPRPRYREGKELSSSLQRMMDDIISHEEELHQLNQSLERRVSRRTEQLKETLATLEASERKLQTITDQLPVLVGYLDKDECYQFVNAVNVPWIPFTRDQLLGRSLAEVMEAELYAEIQPNIQYALSGHQVTFEYRREIGDQTYYLEADVIPDRDLEGNVCGLILMVDDVTDRKEHEKQLTWQLQHDPLTGILNRRGLKVRLELAIDRSRRFGAPMAVMFIDLDRFKAVNDTYGHEAGDQVIKVTASRLVELVRKTDSVARISGDEFVVIAEALKTPPADVTVMAEKMNRALAEPVDLGDGKTASVSASIGIAYTNAPIGLTQEQLLNRADEAMYQCKRKGRDTFHIVRAEDEPGQAMA